jgi:enamine deaminase RidA (YjgF/YER057c/UK114 family)
MTKTELEEINDRLNAELSAAIKREAILIEQLKLMTERYQKLTVYMEQVRDYMNAMQSEM